MGHFPELGLTPRPPLPVRSTPRPAFICSQVSTVATALLSLLDPFKVSSAPACVRRVDCCMYQIHACCAIGFMDPFMISSVQQYASGLWTAVRGRLYKAYVCDHDPCYMISPALQHYTGSTGTINIYFSVRSRGCMCVFLPEASSQLSFLLPKSGCGAACGFDCTAAIAARMFRRQQHVYA